MDPANGAGSSTRGQDCVKTRVSRVWVARGIRWHDLGGVPRTRRLIQTSASQEGQPLKPGGVRAFVDPDLAFSFVFRRTV